MLLWLVATESPQGRARTEKEAMASANDMKAHNGTYEGFISLLKVSIPVLAIITAVVIALIA